MARSSKESAYVISFSLGGNLDFRVDDVSRVASGGMHLSVSLNSFRFADFFFITEADKQYRSTLVV